MAQKVVGLFNWNDNGKLELVKLYEHSIATDKRMIQDAGADCKARYPERKIRKGEFDRDNYAHPPGFIACVFIVGGHISHDEVYIYKNITVQGE